MPWWRVVFIGNGVPTDQTPQDGPHKTEAEASIGWAKYTRNWPKEIVIAWQSRHYPMGLRVRRKQIDWKSEIP